MPISMSIHESQSLFNEVMVGRKGVLAGRISKNASGVCANV